MRRSIITLVAVTLLLAAVPAEAAPEPVAATAECAPPCGSIYPIISLTADLKIPISSLELGELPGSVPIKVKYWWDMEQEGTGAPDKEEMTIDFAITHEPTWLDASLDKTSCAFILTPYPTEYEPPECAITMKLDIVGPLPQTEEAFEEAGKRVMLFATSAQSGTFERSYGVKDLRISWEGAPSLSDAETESTATEEAPMPAMVAPVALGLLGLAASRRRH